MTNTIRLDIPTKYCPEPLTTNAAQARRILAEEYEPRTSVAEGAHKAARETKNTAYVLQTYLTAKDACIEQFQAELRRDQAENDLAYAVHSLYVAGSPIPEYTGTSLGAAKLLGIAESGTAEWHELRQQGIGGSQILEVGGFEDKGGYLRRKSELYYSYTLRDLFSEKTTDPSTLVETPSFDATWRGHTWEPVLLDIHRQLSGLNVVIGKQTWQGKYPWQVVNVDGIIVDDSGKPYALVECKNSNAGYRWSKGVPLSYRAQVLYYLDTTELDFCDIIYRVNGDVYVTRVWRGESIDGTATGSDITSLYGGVSAAWGALQDVKANPERINAYVPPYRQPIGTHAASWAAAYENVWALLHYVMTRDEVVAELRARKNATGSLDTAVRSLLHERFDASRLGRMVGIDGETASITSTGRNRPFSPLYSDWIETGLAELKPVGEPTFVQSWRHGADPRIIAVNGTGAQHIHGISPEDIKGMSTFAQDCEVVRERLGESDIIVAHNVRFEKKFLEPVMFDVVTSRPWLDTMWLTKHFMPDTTGHDRNTLEGFVTGLGMAYIDAHQADKDARMMMEALRVFLNAWRP